jgi:hypothetical protein
MATTKSSSAKTGGAKKSATGGKEKSVNEQRIG